MELAPDLIRPTEFFHRADGAAAKAQIAKHAVQLLLNRLAGDDSPPTEIAADYDLVIRESTR
ncbi:hypothetical protein OG809_35515 [Kribbella soli]